MASKTQYGPDNPHPFSTIRTELIWEGKYDEYGNRREVDVAGSAFPLQKIETVDEPRSRAEVQGLLFEPQKSHRDDFRNRLIWGDNKLVMASLLKEFKGQIDLIYIDPPFDVGADFTMNLAIGDEKDQVVKDQSTLEMVAYRDMWGRGTDSYINMLAERLLLMKKLLSEIGAIFVHCDWRVSSVIRLLLDDIFSQEFFRDELIWRRGNINTQTQSNQFPRNHDVIFFYRSPISKYSRQFKPYSDSTMRMYRFDDHDGRGLYRLQTLRTYSQDSIEKMRSEGKIVEASNGSINFKQYLSEKEGVVIDDVWDDIPSLQGNSSERTDYDTQKPEALLERIIKATSNEGDLVADFFCGSGTTGAVAEKLGRRWIMADLGRFAIHTSRKRLIEIQRKLHEEHEPYRSFDVYNLGRYERQWWQKESLKGADKEHRRVVLEFYRAEPLFNSPNPLLHGRKGPAYVHVDDIDSIFGRKEVRQVALAAQSIGARELNCLAWEFEMDLPMVCDNLEKELGVRIKLIRIPREIMERNRKDPPPFFEVASLQAEPVYRTDGSKRTVDIKLTSFLPSLTEVPEKELTALQERAVQSGFDFIDFWAVDFNYHPDQPFNHHWQTFRTRRDRSLPTVSDQAYHYEQPGNYTACVKVVDVFGADTSITVPIKI